MPTPLRITLVGDGGVDRCLLPVLRWILRRTVGIQHCDLRLSFSPPTSDSPAKGGLTARISWALRDFPCDLLFVHRDAEGVPLKSRIQEIEIASAGVDTVVPVVPVRMSEAWLLFDEAAIRRAAGNPAGRVDLRLPPTAELERLTDPKSTLRRALLDASELNRRRRGRLDRDLPQRVVRVAELIDDFSPLDVLPAFAELRRRTALAVRQIPTSAP